VKALYLLAASIVLAGCATQKIQPNAEIGFRGAVIGSEPLPEMKLLEKWRPSLGLSSREISDAYSMPHESTTLGDLTIKDVTYEYHKKRLFRIVVNLWTQSQMSCPNAAELIAALESQYKISMIQHQADYIRHEFMSQWRGSKAWVTYMCWPSNSTNSITIESPSLVQEVEETLRVIKTSKERNATEKMKRALQ
jgi:hypothetical protein